MRDSQPEVDRKVNSKLIDADKRSTDHQRMVDRTPYQVRFDAVVRHCGAKDRTAFGDLLGQSKAVISNWYRRNQRVPEKERKRFQERTGVSLDWLNDNDGDMVMQPKSTSITASETAAPYVRIDQIDAGGDMGDGQVNEDYPDVIQAMDFTDTYIRGLIGYKPPPGRLKLLTGRGDSMVPVIQPGDVVVVDTGCESFDGDGIYLINTGAGQQIKALQDRGDAVYVVSANSQLYPPFPAPAGTIIGGKVYLRNRLDRLN